MKEKEEQRLPARQNFLLLTKIAKISDRKKERNVIVLYYNFFKNIYTRTFTCEMIDVIIIKGKISNASDLFIVLISIQLRHFVEENYLFTLVQFWKVTSLS